MKDTGEKKQHNNLGQPSNSVILRFKDFLIIESSIMELKKTGIYIDPYSDTRISPEHAKLLANSIGNSKSSKIAKLVAMLNKAGEKSKWIIVLGN